MASTLSHPPVCDARDITVTATLFDHERDTIPKPWTGRFGDLLGQVHQLRESKTGTRCFSTAVYSEGARRGNSGVSFQTALVFDLDHVTDDQLSTAWAWLSQHAGAMYTSHSDRAARPTDRCARLVVLLTRWVTPNEARVLAAEVARLLAVPTDPHTTDPARIWFMPTCPQARFSGAFIAYTSGALLDPEPLLVAARLASPPKRRVSKPVADWRVLVSNGATPGGRHGAVVRLAAHLLGKKVDPVVTLHLVLAWNAAKNSPPKPDDEVIAAVNYVAGRELDRRECRHDR
jgi:hypothetical protein